MKSRFAIAMLLGCALTCVLPSGYALAGGRPPAPSLVFCEDPGRLILRDAFSSGSMLFARAALLDSRCWRIVWKDPAGAVARTDVLAGTSATRDIAFTVPPAGPSGAWTAELQQGDQNPGGPDPCSATTSYTTRQIGRFDVARIVIMGAVEAAGIGGDGGIEEQNPGTVPGGGVGPDLTVRTDSGKNMRTFIRFDLSGAGISGSVAVAKLRLVMSTAPSSSRIYEVRRVTGTWLESALKWSNRPAVITGITDARSTGSTSAQPIYWLVGSDVAAFANGAFSNYGWEIRDAVEDYPGGSREAKFVSTEASSLDKTKWPVLLVDYDQSPVASAGGPYPSTCRTATIGGASALDPEGEILTYSWSSSSPSVAVSPASGAIDAGSGARPIPAATATLSNSVAPSGQSAILTLTVSDGHGNTVTSTAPVTFNDDILPQITAPASRTAGTSDDGTGNCSTTVSLGLPVVSDNCTLPAGMVVTNDTPATFPTGQTIVTWTARDEVGNRSSATQTVTVNDNENPALSGMPSGFTVGTGPGATTASAFASWAAPLASDNCPGVTLTSNHAPGESFALGATTVTYTATDVTGRTTSRSFAVTVVDDTRPVLAVGADLVAPTDDGQCAAHLAALGTSASDNAPGMALTGARSDGGALGDAFSKGVTTIAWTATDAAGNTAGATQTVTVNDLESPKLSGMPGALALGTGPGATTPTAMASWTVPLASDNCPGVTLSSDHAPGESFPLGVTTVTYTATDAAGHAAGQSFTVTVADDTPPVIAMANLTVPTDDGQCAAQIAVLGTSASDNAPGVTLTGVRGDGAALGDPFPGGATPIVWSATDAAGNTETVIQTVTVNDMEKPVIAPGSSLSVATDVGLATAQIAGLGTSANDNCPGVALAGTRSDDQALGAPYPIGVTTVSWRATDWFGNQSNTVQTVTVADRENPVIALGGNVTVPTDDGQCAAHVASLGTTASDNAPGVTLTAVRSDGGAIGDAFPGGVTTITWTATDASGNAVTATQAFTVNDIENPALSGMPAALALGTGPDATTSSAAASWSSPLASDNCPGVTLTADHAPGEILPLGVTTVTYTATDAAGHTASQSFTVTVTDDTEPVVVVGADVTVPTDAGQCAASIAALGTSATDNAPGVRLVAIRGDGAALTDPFQAGATPIAWIATDGAGNSASAIQTVIVNDMEPPAIAPAAGISVAPDAGFSTAWVTVLGPAAGDNCPGVALEGRRSDEVPLTEPFPTGVTTIAWSATDGSGNRASTIQTVTVADRDRPVIALGVDLTVPTDAGQCAAVVASLGTTATDNVGVTTLFGVRSDGAALADPFPAGATTITWTASDAAGNSRSAVQAVNVDDVESPVLSGMPDDLEIGTGPDATTATAAADWMAPVASDNCPGVTMSSSHNPGESFPLGATVVTYTATDAAGHATSWSFRVIVVDDTPPTIAAEDMTVPTDDDACQAQIASLGAVVSDNAPGVRLVAIRGGGAPIGDPFQRGATMVAWIATDAAGNTTSSIQTVIVNDTESPAILAPPAVHATTGVGATTASVIVSDLQLGTAFASDNCSGARISRSGVPAGNRFPVGATEIRYTATDESGNSRTVTQLVTVVDDTPPVLARPSNIARGSEPGTCEAAVTFTASASDNSPGVRVTFAPPSGSRFPVGASTVFCTATDAAGNHVETSFTVTVSNPSPIAAITGPATGTLVPAGSPVSFTGSFTDNAGDTHSVQWMLDSFAVPGTVNETMSSVSGSYAFSAAGVYLVQLPVTDLCGGSATAAQINRIDEMIVVFDPGAEFAAGGGRFDSPAGALTASPGTAGDAGFGFVSKTRKSATGPAGDAEFYFQLGNFRFHASSYNALALADGTALYRGTGTVNDAGSYGFVLSAVDGQEFNDVDRIRLRITNAAGAVVYDNEPGADVTSPAATEITAGAIEVHSGRLVASTRAFDANTEGAGGLAAAIPVAYALPPNFPNPFAGSTGLRFDLPQPSAVSLTVYDVLGREVASLVHGDLPAGRHQRTWNTRDARGGQVPAGVYVVRMEATPLSGGRLFTTRRKLVLLP